MLETILAINLVALSVNVYKRMIDRQIEQACDSLIQMEDKQLQQDIFSMMERIHNQNK